MKNRKASLQEINEKVECILDLCQKDPDLKPFALRFQFEHAAAKAAYHGSSSEEQVAHMKKTLERMVDLALDNALLILNRSVFSRKPNEEYSLNPSSSPNVLRVSSVDDFTLDGDLGKECRANVSYLCVELLSLLIVVVDTMGTHVQNYLCERDVVTFLAMSLGVSKEVELEYFVEGHKTEVLRLLANVVYGNSAVCEMIVEKDDLLLQILASTRIDEDNPGSCEWAKFAIRNICGLSIIAQERIKQLEPLAMTPESSKMMANRYSSSFTPEGQCKIVPIAE